MKELNLLIFLFGIVFLQKPTNSLVVEYSHNIHLEGIPNKTSILSTLIMNEESSLYEMDFVGSENLVTEEASERGPVLRIKASTNPKIFKNLKEQTIYSTERISMKPYLVKDNMKIFKWSLESEYKTILGYKCQKAILYHRGRNYIAYFTTELNFRGGPWKFDGLPGLILQIESIDGAFKINATKLQMKKIEVNIENPFQKEDTLTWEEYISFYKIKYEELLHYRDSNGGRRSLPKKNIEEFIKY